MNTLPTKQPTDAAAEVTDTEPSITPDDLREEA